MKTKTIYILACLAFTTIVNGADTATPLLPASETTSLIRPSGAVAASSGLDDSTAVEVRNLLREDYKRNVKDLIGTRWFFRKVSNCTEAFGNTLVYTSAGFAAIAGSIRLVGSEDISNGFLFASNACLAAHVALIGVAKCSAREEGEREHLLEELAGKVGFKVVALNPTIADDASVPAPTAATTAKSTVVHLGGEGAQ